MRTPVKLAGFAVAVAAVLAASFGVGSAVGPVGHADTHIAERHDMSQSTDHSGSGHARGGHSSPDPSGNLPGGLMVSQDGYTLDLASTVLDQGRTTVNFRILGADGQPLTAFEPTHDADLHFFAVKRDLSGFHHLHPTRDASGTWTIDVDLSAGVWRVLTDFRPVGHETMTLGIDAFVAGDYVPQPLPPVDSTAMVDGYTVTLNGQLVAGESRELTLTVSRDGIPVTDLEPYLAAYGHLVALRSGDMAYLHVHPDGAPGDGITEPGPDITFFATAPSAGPYRLYLDFKHDGVVRTAEFTAHASGGISASGDAVPGTQDAGAHAHN